MCKRRTRQERLELKGLLWKRQAYLTKYEQAPSRLPDGEYASGMRRFILDKRIGKPRVDWSFRSTGAKRG